MIRDLAGLGSPLLLITDRHGVRQRPLVEVVAACLGAGLGAVQLRDTDLPAAERLALAVQLRDMTARHGARLLVNGDVDVAMRAEADGIHLPAALLGAASSVREAIGPGRLLGVSTHSADEVAAAAAAGADFAVFGPVYETPSKRAFGAPQGTERLAEACRRVSMPVLAIGGVTAAAMPALRNAGAAGAAVIRALLAATDPAHATVELLGAWTQASG